jgi:hypothetical protein
MRALLFLSLFIGLRAVPALSETPEGVCPGDCDRSRSVTVDELVTGVGIALATRALDDCPVFDRNDDRAVSVDELIPAVNAALQGCFAPTPFATREPTAAPTPTPTNTRVPLPEQWVEAFDASPYGWMMSGWGPGDGTLWVVGGTPSRGRIIAHRDNEWREVDPGVAAPLLNWVHGTSATDVFVGGNDGTVLHFDGTAWVQHETPTVAAVWGVFAVAPNDVWAVGGDPLADDPPLVMRYDGHGWALVSIPPLQRPRVFAFFKVWASGPDDVYIIGQNGAVLRFDGDSLTELFIGISQDLVGVWGTGRDNFMIVGGRGTAELAHFDGTNWQRVHSAFPGLSGVWLRRPDVAHAVGVAGTILRVDPRTLGAEEADAPLTRLDLHSIFGDASGQLIALGANFAAPERGVALIRRLSDDD